MNKYISNICKKIMSHVFLKEIIFFGIGIVLAAFFGFSGTVITARIISTSEFAKYNFLIFLSANISSISILAFDQSLTREYNDEKNSTKLLYNTIVTPIILCMLICVILFILSDRFYIKYFEEKKSISLIFAIMSFVCLQNTNNILSNFIRMKQSGVLYSAANVASKLSYVIILGFIIAFVSTSVNYRLIFFISILSLIITIIIEIIILRKDIAISFNLFDLKLQKRMIKFGLPLVLANFIISFIPTGMILLMRRYISLDEIGIYTGGLKLVNLLGLIQAVFSVIWVPISYKLIKKNNAREKITAVSDMVCSIMLVFYIIINMLKIPIAAILGSSYARVSEILPFLTIQVVLYTVSEVYIIGVYQSRKTNYNIFISIFTAVTCFIFGYLLIRRFGIIGASISMALAYIVFFIIRIIYSKKYFGNLNMKKTWLYIFLILCISATSLVNDKYFNYIFQIVIIFIMRKDIVNNLKTGIIAIEKID